MKITSQVILAKLHINQSIQTLFTDDNYKNNIRSSSEMLLQVEFNYFRGKRHH